MKTQDSDCTHTMCHMDQAMGSNLLQVFLNVDDANSYWVVRPMPESPAKQGERIKSGSVIRLQHVKTRRWLHSHLHASPISGNLEVCGLAFFSFLLNTMLFWFAGGLSGSSISTLG